jgi:hypothetical protein
MIFDKKSAKIVHLDGGKREKQRQENDPIGWPINRLVICICVHACVRRIFDDNSRLERTHRQARERARGHLSGGGDARFVGEKSNVRDGSLVRAVRDDNGRV